MIEKFGNFMLGVFTTLLAATHPYAAIGAAFGCVFFLTVPIAAHGWKRIKLCVSSWGIGYAAGVFFYGEGPPWDEKAMMVATFMSALGAVMFTAFYYVIDKSGPLPPWLESILDRVPMFKRRGDNDGS